MKKLFTTLLLFVMCATYAAAEETAASKQDLKIEKSYLTAVLANKKKSKLHNIAVKNCFLLLIVVNSSDSIEQLAKDVK